MTDHHDFGDHHDDYAGGDHQHHEDLPYGYDEPGHEAYGPDDHDSWLTPEHDDHGLYETHPADTPVVEHHDTAAAPDDPHLPDAHLDHTTVDDAYPDPADMFPPHVDVGALPEPVDGYPWIDTATLGTPDLHVTDDHTPVDPHELAEYAGTDLPPGADPWTVLAASDDPATSMLARFWHDTTD